MDLKLSISILASEDEIQRARFFFLINIRPVLKLGKNIKNFSKKFSQKELITMGGNYIHVWLE